MKRDHKVSPELSCICFLPIIWQHTLPRLAENYKIFAFLKMLKPAGLAVQRFHAKTSHIWAAWRAQSIVVSRSTCFHSANSLQKSDHRYHSHAPQTDRQTSYPQCHVLKCACATPASGEASPSVFPWVILFKKWLKLLVSGEKMMEEMFFNVKGSFQLTWLLHKWILKKYIPSTKEGMEIVLGKQDCKFIV